MAYVNMALSGATCPQGLTQFTLLRTHSLWQERTVHLCQSTMFFTLGLSYSQVCGQLRGYRLGFPDAFSPYNDTGSPKSVDEVCILMEHPSHMIPLLVNTSGLIRCGFGHDTLACPWTIQYASCPCNNVRRLISAPPPYVGNDYYCETGDNDYTCCNATQLYSSDPLWDGQQCPGVGGSLLYSPQHAVVQQDT